MLRPIIGASSGCFRGVGSFGRRVYEEVAASWFEYMKVRFSWGRTGKDNIKAWGWKQLYSLDPSRGYGFGSNGGILQTGIKPGATPNPDAHWDNTDKFNLGLICVPQ